MQYGISKLGDNAYSAVGDVLGHITSAEVGLYVMRDLTDKDTGAGALQRTIIDRVLSLLPREHAPTAFMKRKHEPSAHEITGDGEDGNPSPGNFSVRPDRIKKPTAKAQQSPPKMTTRKSAPATPNFLNKGQS
jgi:hypothetical protein